MLRAQTNSLYTIFSSTARCSSGCLCHFKESQVQIEKSYTTAYFATNVCNIEILLLAENELILFLPWVII